jgi:hypothetical protein
MSRVPRPTAGNILTVGDYQQRWLDQYTVEAANHGAAVRASCARPLSPAGTADHAPTASPTAPNSAGATPTATSPTRRCVTGHTPDAFTLPPPNRSTSFTPPPNSPASTCAAPATPPPRNARQPPAVRVTASASLSTSLSSFPATRGAATPPSTTHSPRENSPGCAPTPSGTGWIVPRWAISAGIRCGHVVGNGRGGYIGNSPGHLETWHIEGAGVTTTPPTSTPQAQRLATSWRRSPTGERMPVTTCLLSTSR